MLNEQRIEHLRQQIQASQILESHEKADWLNLLELMNDKQLGELEEILSAPKSTASTASQASLPPLTHISNLPTEVNAPHAASPKPPLFSPATQTSRPVTAQPAPAIPRVLNPQPISRPAPVRSAPRPAQVTPMHPLVIPNPSALQTLDVGTLREHEHAAIIQGVQAVAQSYGYFAALQHFEASPLYAAYLTAGKNRLMGRPDSGLSQAEFELVADILQAIRLNRV